MLFHSLRLLQQELLRYLYFLFSGSDACAQGHDCQHICINSGDSYNCKCRVGYVLNADQKTCSRKDLAFFQNIYWYLCVKSMKILSIFEISSKLRTSSANPFMLLPCELSCTTVVELSRLEPTYQKVLHRWTYYSWVLNGNISSQVLTAGQEVIEYTLWWYLKRLCQRWKDHMLDLTRAILQWSLMMLLRWDAYFLNAMAHWLSRIHYKFLLCHISQDI